MSRLVILALMFSPLVASAHDIYQGLTVKDGRLPCCGGESAGAARDCWRTVYRERGARFEFRMQNGDWLEVPSDRIQFTPIPGDRYDDGETHAAHLCYRDDAETVANYHDHGVTERMMKSERGADVVFFCAILPPGGL